MTRRHAPCVGLATAIVVGAVATRHALRPPGTPPTYRGPRPGQDDDPRAYVSHTEVREVALDVGPYVAWSQAAPLDDLLPGQPRIPAVVRTDLLTGEWNRPGARRRVVLADGHTAAEEILECGWRPDGSHVFAYEVFGYTNYAGLGIDHAVGRFTSTPLAAGSTRVTWTYAYHPRHRLVRPLVGVFVTRVWAPYMRDVLTGMRRLAHEDAARSGGPSDDATCP